MAISHHMPPCEGEGSFKGTWDTIPYIFVQNEGLFFMLLSTSKQVNYKMRMNWRDNKSSGYDWMRYYNKLTCGTRNLENK